MSERNPFILLEATFALYAVDVNDQPTSEIYMGGCVEKCTLDGERKEQRLEYPGVAQGRIYHADEMHSIVLENLWLHEQFTGGSRMPVLRRNRRYQLVITWEDPELGVWNKRVYTGVTAQPERVEESAQTLRLAAEQKFDFPGTGTIPDVTPSLPGLVVYVDPAGSGEVVDLYYFDFGTGIYSQLLEPGYAEIDFSVPGECTVRIGGNVALRADARGLHVAELVATGGTFLTGDAAEEPRLEWYRNSSRVASLSQSGVLAVADLVEQPAAPDAIDDFEHKNPAWLFSLANARAYAPEFAEDLV